MWYFGWLTPLKWTWLYQDSEITLSDTGTYGICEILQAFTNTSIRYCLKTLQYGDYEASVKTLITATTKNIGATMTIAENISQEDQLANSKVKTAPYNKYCPITIYKYSFFTNSVLLFYNLLGLS